MIEKRGPVTVTFEFGPGDEVQTSLGDLGIVEACTLERGGLHYTISVAGGERAWFHEDNVHTRPVEESPADVEPAPV